MGRASRTTPAASSTTYLYELRRTSDHPGRAGRAPRLFPSGCWQPWRVLRAVGALLAAIGLFGLFAYIVARQTKEIGIRMALGATRGRVSRMVATNAGWLVSVGFLLGAPRRSGYTIRRAQRRESSGWRGGAHCLGRLIAVAFIAVYVPTRRATRVEPVIALRGAE